MDYMGNSIRLVWKLAFILSTYRTCNSMVGFLKYEFNNKLLDDVTLFRITPGVTWIKISLSLSLSLYIYIYIIVMMSKLQGFKSYFIFKAPLEF